MRGLWLLFPALLIDGGEVRKDLEYARPGGVAIHLDAYVPDSPGPHPAVIWVHGGGFVGGDKHPAPLSLLTPLAREGWAWISVNYRLAPQHVFPAQTDDVDAALAYVRSHAHKLKVDPQRLVLMGASAGGHLVSFVGARHRRGNRAAAVVSFFGEHDLVDRVHPRGPCMMDGKVVEQPGPTCLSPGLARYLGITGGAPHAEEIVRRASPARYVHRDMPPYLLIHGTRDFGVPFEQSVRMQETMRKAGARCDLIRVEGGGHGFGAWDQDPAMAAYRQQMLAWLKEVVR